VHINPSLWIKVEKPGEINLTGITATPPCCKSGARKLCKTIMYKKRPSAVRLALVSPLRGSSIQFALTHALQPWVSAAKLAHYSPAKEQQTARTTAEEGGFSRS